MCGIAGAFHFRDAQAVDPVLLKRMADSMVHRGPDDEGFFASGPVGLAHRRLSIIDVKGGHQPMSNENDTVWIVFNGEIYNHAELRPILEGKGHRYKTDCDTETILHAYEEYGEQCVERLQGMFAFALWDQRKKTFLMARDRLGIKPLYYAVADGRILFGSEIKPLLAALPSRPALDVESLDCYLSLSYVPTPWTLFQGIVKLPPGHLMTATPGQVRITSYWDLQYGPKAAASDAALEEELEEMLTGALRSHLMSEVPLGVFLSGGLDSGFVAAGMTRRLQVPCQTFSIGYDDGDEETELTDARWTAARFGTTHHEYRIGAKDMVEEFPKILRHLEEPVASSATIPLYFLARASREHVTVVLSGEGADELLGGYTRYRHMLQAERLHRMAPLRPAWAALQGLLGESRPGRFFQDAGLPLERRYQGIASAFWPGERRHLRLAPFRDARLEQTLVRHHGRSGAEALLDRMLYFDTKVYLVDDLLLKADKMTMAASMELRVPFLDHRVVEFCARLPVHLKVGGGTSKVLLRKLLHRYFPPEYLNRPKKGFPIPLARWFRSGLRGHISQVILDPGSLSRRLFERPFLDSLLQRAASGVEANARKLWALYQLERWREIFEVRT
jgi:asparagine synthase (glutamine-hydrolysing)